MKRLSIAGLIAASIANQLNAGRGIRRVAEWKRHKPTAHRRATNSKYTPHQGAHECARRRKQMGTGEFAPGFQPYPSTTETP